MNDKMCEYCGKNSAAEWGMCQECIDYFEEEDRNHRCAVVGCEEVIPVGHDICPNHNV